MEDVRPNGTFLIVILILVIVVMLQEEVRCTSS